MAPKRPLRLAVVVALCALSLLAEPTSSTVAARLAKQARKSQDAGQLVRAYLLYSEAAVRDPSVKSYQANRDLLAPLTQLLTKPDIQAADIREDLAASESDSPEPLPQLPLGDQSTEADLQPVPHLLPSDALRNFDLRGDARSAIEQVARAYGVSASFDPDFQADPVTRFQLQSASFKTAMEGIASVTGAFVFPISQKAVFVARDTETKRSEFEPVSVIAIPLPEAVDPKQVVEAANAVRTVLSLRAVSWDSVGRVLIIRDRASRVRLAASILNTLLLPRPQLQFEVQILAVDSSRYFHYGAALPTSFPTLSYVHLGGFQPALPNLSSIGSLFAFASGTNFFGVALGNATLFAQYTKSNSKVLYDATVTVSDGQTANLHVGDKYPIPQAISTGYSQLQNSLYNPIGQVTMEDLGIVLKLSPRVNGDGDISLDLEAEYKALGPTIIEDIPAIAQRTFKGSVQLREGEFAVIAGMQSDQRTRTRTGIQGLADIPGLDEVLAENTRNDATSDTLIVIKPTITRLPMSSTVSPQFLVGAASGERVLM